MNRNLKYLKTFESLNYSNDISEILHSMRDNKVAKFLELLNGDDNYKDNEDVNFLALAKDVDKISFNPLKRRQINTSYLQLFKPNVMPTKVGRLVRRIYDTFKENLTHEQDIEIAIGYRWDSAYIRLPRLLECFLTTESQLAKTYIDIEIHSTVDSDGVTKLDKPFIISGLFNNHHTFYKPSIITWFTEPEANKSIYYLLQVVDEWGDDAAAETLSKMDPSLNYIAKIKTKVDFELKDKDIEDFSNRFIAFQKKFRSSESSNIKIVKGEDIRYWYNKDRYKLEKGQLGNSCMRHERCQPYLDIYCHNINQVSLMILLDEEEKLIARALLWTLDDGKKLLDRCYSIMDYDIQVYHNIAKEKGWYYSKSGDIYLGESKYDGVLKATLDHVNYKQYPFMDSLSYLDMNTHIVSTHITGLKTDTRYLIETDGSWQNIWEEDEV